MPFPRQQIVLSGLGGQGVLFVSRLLAEAAIRKGEPVLTSETHGMAQRGGVVVSHLKVGGFASPLVRAGQADGLFVLSEENFPHHRAFLRPAGWAVVNARPGRKDEPRGAIHAIDADGLALSAGNGPAANLVLLGFALSRLGARDEGGLLFCTAEGVREALAERLGEKGSLLQASLDAVALGMLHGKR
ncbi:MAG: 2-oxoacid:acceptor oxidoreductase family protein [Deltaproteobacteria bacterium]|nr:2-oxoacid:acceptor oxidoreductase family protein [Deltaproteobacteria bacterium]